ncbi:hypothetical protein HN031_15095 [Nocardioides sp. zg-1308]|uniref:hypothetical protein n=1 Tax=Nocardioides sp. zg-1308 TaxID=2736253 RepID=UPI001557CCAB|nr:hypothetical protein [Nocardioides sp. zg-1308]NPD06006.1 hypothetical protein [Nocardioides sp. zg-1308]
MVVLFAAGCGSDSASTTESGDASSSASSPAASGETPEISEEFTACLEEQGVELPSEQPTEAPSEGTMPSLDPEIQEAMRACASLAPSGGPGGAGAPEVDQSALDAFADCMDENGVEVEATLEAVTELDQSEQKVRKALETCSALIQP